MLTEDATARQHLRHALDELPPTWRAVVERHDCAGRSDTDIARVLGITREQERNILTRARAALRDQLAELLNRRGAR
jgi:RNA polymerase sigma factor (sigma-70 family)